MTKQRMTLERVREYTLLAYLAESRRLDRCDDLLADTATLDHYRRALALLDRLERVPASPMPGTRRNTIQRLCDAIASYRTRRALRAYVESL
jgi:hypothetical protein